MPRKIGLIQLLQVQPEPLKRGVHPQRVYDPSPLRRVPRLLLTSEGAFGLPLGGGKIMDVHHRAHPRTRNRRGKNAISIGFSGHYRLMWERFGERVTPGVAGENIIIAADCPLRFEELQAGLLVASPFGDTVSLRVSRPMAPCEEFSHFVVGAQGRMEANRLREVLQFLHNGRRGFIVELEEGSHQAEIRVGDCVYLSD